MALLEGKREEEDVVLLDEDVQVLQGLQGLEGLQGLRGLQGLLNHLFSDSIMRQCAGKCKLHLRIKFVQQYTASSFSALILYAFGFRL
jgi:hypothetical protein